MTDIITLSNELDNQPVAVVLGKPVTRKQLSAAFNRVADKTNWKNPISATVELAKHREMAMIKEAVTFFTGSIATFHAIPGAPKPLCRYRVAAPGYYLTCGA